MTAPLTPPDADLQDFPFMPLHVARLRDSDMASIESPEACWYAVLLWSISWHQLPAGSLPNDDAVLAKLLGLGRDVRTFRKHKAGALRGFVLCDDGRLYHPVVAEQVIEAWDRKLQQRWRTECARIKKSNQRNGLNEPLPTLEEFLSRTTGAPRPGFVPRDVPGDKAECPPGQTLQGTGTGTGTGTETSNITPRPGAATPESSPVSPVDLAAANDPDGTAWATGVSVLKGKGVSEAQARAFIGKLLRDHKLQARDLLTTFAAALVNGTHDPKSYVAKAAKQIADRRNEPRVEKRVDWV